MKIPKRLIACLGVLMLSASPLVHVAAQEQWNHHNGPQYDHRGPGPGPQYRKPPRDFGPIRQSIRDNHRYFVRGAPPPPGIHLVRGRPLPHGYYGERLDRRALSHLPYYHGYEWRRMGNNIVLISVRNGVVYEVLDGVLY